MAVVRPRCAPIPWAKAWRRCCWGCPLQCRHFIVHVLGVTPSERDFENTAVLSLAGNGEDTPQAHIPIFSGQVRLAAFLAVDGCVVHERSETGHGIVMATGEVGLEAKLA